MRNKRKQIQDLIETLSAESAVAAVLEKEPKENKQSDDLKQEDVQKQTDNKAGEKQEEEGVKNGQKGQKSTDAQRNEDQSQAESNAVRHVTRRRKPEIPVRRTPNSTDSGVIEIE